MDEMAKPHQDSGGAVPEGSKQGEMLDLENKPREMHETPEYEDPFGSEEFAEVKYRTLRWW